MGSGYIVQRGGGSKPSGTISIIENGTVDVTEYAAANVNVEDPNLAAIIDRSITSITIPNDVTKIKDYAFSYCRLLISVTIPNSVTNIDIYSFYYCESLTSIDIPSSVRMIGSSAFERCTSLRSITIRATIPPLYVDNTTFSGIATGSKIYVPEESVDTYKAAEGWSTYASKIQAIHST